MPPTDETSSSWYLHKHDDGTVFGPVTMAQLVSWAASAQISPLDKVSDNQKEWNRAPTYPDLEMDWLVQSSPGQLYGPTTVGAVKEFLKVGEITMNSLAINCATSEEMTVKNIPLLLADENFGVEIEEPGKASTKEHLQQRIIDLEEVILEERNLKRTAEDRYNKLAARYRAATGQDP